MLPVVQTILITFCLTGSLAQVDGDSFRERTWDREWPGHWYTDDYLIIDDYLVEKVPSWEPVSANIDALVERLRSDSVDEREKIVMRKLVGLRVTEGRCDQISYEALQDSDKATEEKPSVVRRSRRLPLRVYKVIRHYGKQHAMTCQEKSESLFKPKLKLLNRQVLDRLSAWLDPMIELILSEFKPRKSLQVGDDISRKVYYGVIKGPIRYSAVLNIKLTYEAIKKLAQDNPEDEQFLHYYTDSLTGTRQFTFKMLFQKYIKSPCFAYVMQMGKLFDRADYDSKYYHQVRSNQPLFYRGWAYNKLCSQAFNQRWPYDQLYNYALKIAEAEEEERIRNLKAQPKRT